MKRFVLFSLLSLFVLSGCREYEIDLGCKNGTISCKDGEINCYKCDGHSWRFCDSMTKCKRDSFVDEQCRSDDECPGEGMCQEGICIWDYECESDVECEVGSCNEGLCSFYSCSDDKECPDGFVCGEFGNCEKFLCESNHDCGPGSICLKDGRCEIKHHDNSVTV